MRQVEAALILREHFFEEVASTVVPGHKVTYLRTAAGALRLPEHCSPQDMQARRRQLGIPDDFRFAWFDLPLGAKYVDDPDYVHPMLREMTVEQKAKLQAIKERAGGVRAVQQAKQDEQDAAEAAKLREENQAALEKMGIRRRE